MEAIRQKKPIIDQKSSDVSVQNPAIKSQNIDYLQNNQAV